MREDLTSGTQDILFGFTTAFFHRPDEVAGEFADAGLECTDLLAIESMALWIPDLAARLSDSDKRALLLELIARTEREPAILGATAHLLAAGR